MTLLIGHVPRGVYRKSYQLRCLFSFFLFGVRSKKNGDEEADIIFHNQGVAPSPRENARRHASEAVEHHMDVDDAQSMGSGMFRKSSVYILDY